MIQYFVLGVLTVYIVLPIIDSVLGIILSLLEVIKGLLALKVANINAKIITTEDPYATRNPIGFLSNIEEEAEEYDSEA